MRKLGPAELGDLLERPLVAVLATYRVKADFSCRRCDTSGATAASMSQSV